MPAEGADRTTSYVDAVVPNVAYVGAEDENLTEAARAATQYQVGAHTHAHTHTHTVSLPCLFLLCKITSHNAHSAFTYEWNDATREG